MYKNRAAYHFPAHLEHLVEKVLAVFRETVKIIHFPGCLKEMMIILMTGMW